MARREEKAKEPRRSPYVRIVEAAKNGRGVRLSHDECCELAADDAIAAVAEHDLDRHRYDIG